MSATSQHTHTHTHYASLQTHMQTRTTPLGMRVYGYLHRVFPVRICRSNFAERTHGGIFYRKRMIDFSVNLQAGLPLKIWIFHLIAHGSSAKFGSFDWRDTLCGVHVWVIHAYITILFVRRMGRACEWAWISIKRVRRPLRAVDVRPFYRTYIYDIICSPLPVRAIPL